MILRCLACKCCNGGGGGNNNNIAIVMSEGKRGACKFESTYSTGDGKLKGKIK